MIRPTRMRIPSYTPIDMEQYITYWREGLAEDRRNRANERVLAEATAAASIDADWGNTIMERHYHEPECECSVCRTNDQLGYDADVSDPSQYCRHGTFIGSWWGPDYMCGACESGEEPVDAWAERKKRRTRYNRGHGSDKIGTKTLRELVAHMLELAEQEERAKDAFYSMSGDLPDWRKSSIRESKEHAHRAEVDYRFAYFGLMTDEQQEWVRAIFRANTHKESREAVAKWSQFVTDLAEKEGWDQATIDEKLAFAEKRHGTKKQDRIDPLAYYTPRTDPRAAFERLDAIQAWTKGA
jgi:hypothetical protein